MAVDPASPRFARQRILAGFGDGQARLADAHVLVVGAGGLGSALLPVLAAAGVGTLTVVDDDAVAESNLHRQTLHAATDVGRNKAVSAVEKLRVLAPDADLRVVDSRFEAGSTFDLLLDVDVIVDATDNPATRYLANDAAAIRGIPLVWGSALAYAGQVGVAWDEKGVDYRDLFPEGDGDTGDSCEVVGVLPSVCGVIGAMMASEVLKLVTGVGDPLLGRVAAYDALTGRTREIEYRRDPEAPRPGSLEERTASAVYDLPDHTVSAEQLAAELAGPTPPVLIDVREPWEAQLVSIPGSVLIPLGELPDRVGEIDSDADVVLYCHHGTRSDRALQFLQRLEFANVRHLTGGVDAWAVKVDPALPRY
jgi:molybdopterin/thiamine biosynthesis adenylyltransferase/rhodanese-related sulfurtransferase